MLKKTMVHGEHESPLFVRTSTAAAMTMGMIPGRFFRDAKLYCINLLLTYNEGCTARCAYCGLSRSRETDGPWNRRSFIRVDWPTIALHDVARSIEGGLCPHVERLCISMITNQRARGDTLKIVERLNSLIDRISVLITPTIVDEEWLRNLKEAGADMVGVAVDAATREIFEKTRGLGVGGPHKWEKYWAVVGKAVKVFGRGRVGVHLITGLGETESEMVETIQRSYDIGSRTHLFSFFPEEGSPMRDHPQPLIGQYRRIQLARYLINYGLSSAELMTFDEAGRISGFGITEKELDEVIESGIPFMTSGCPGKTLDNACNRPFANCTPYQAYRGELRNYPFRPNAADIRSIRRQLLRYLSPSRA